MQKLKGSVGQGGSNKKGDVVRVQTSLNLVPPDLGGPDPKLKMDDWIGPKTIGAITKFQKFQFGKFDGRIDPGEHTERRINELEGTDRVIPMMLLPAAREQARKWTQAAIQALAPMTVSAPREANAFAGDSIMLVFLVEFGRPTKQPAGSRFKTGTDTELNLLKSRFADMARVLAADGTFLAIKTEFEDMYGMISPQRYHAVSPLSVAGRFIAPHYKFCDWDGVNEFGFGPKTRAGMILQAAATVALGQTTDSVQADKMWIESLMSSADSALQAADRYSYFAQQMFLRTRPLSEFCHYPSTGGWKDLPGLP